MTAGKLAARVLEPEIMDDPGLDRARHWAALQSLARINWFARSSRIVWGPIRQLARRLGRSSLRVLDIATGAGDLPIDLCRRARRQGIDLQLLGVDVSERAIEFAASRAEKGDAGVQFQVLDALQDELPAGFDVATCSLFLHHLNEADARRLLHKMARCAQHLVVVSDLRRCRRGWWLAYAGSRLFTSSDVVHTDACLSVQAAFTVDEVRRMAGEANLATPVVRCRWPFRFVLTAGASA